MPDLNTYENAENIQKFKGTHVRDGSRYAHAEEEKGKLGKISKPSLEPLHHQASI